MSKEKDGKKLREFEKIKTERDDYLNGWKRAKADYENLKKQTEKEKSEFVKFANLNLIMQLIPVYNNVKLSSEHLPDNLKNNNWAQGIEQIKKQFKLVLEENGVTEIIPRVGDEFNPSEHEAIKREARSERLETGNANGANKIIKMVSEGYKLNGKVVVAAKVVVK